jgi:ABC-type branched-subunit amino acid transport system substrate-binding protein
VFRNFITPSMQVQKLVEYAVDRMEVYRFAVLYPDEPYGATFMHLFWDELLARGASVAGLEKYNPSHTDFSDPIKKLVGLYYELPEEIAEPAQQGPVSDSPLLPKEFWGGGDSGAARNWREAIQGLLPDGLTGDDPEEEEPEPIVDFKAVFIPDSPEKAGLIIPQLAYYDVDEVFCLGTNLWHSKRFIQMAPKHVEGAICPAGFFAESRRRGVREFVGDFVETYDRRPGFIEAASFDTAAMLVDLVRGASYAGRRYTAEKLSMMPPYTGVTGRTWFDANGEAVKELYLLKVSGEQFVELGRF